MKHSKLITFLLACLCVGSASFVGCDFLSESSSGESSSSIPSSEAEASESMESIPSVEEQREALKTICKNTFDIKNYTATIEITRTALRDGKPWMTEIQHKEALTLKFNDNKTYAHDIITNTIDDEYSSESFEYLIWQGTSVQFYRRYANRVDWIIREYHENHDEYNDVTYMRVIEYDFLLDIIINNLSYDAETGLYVGSNILLGSEMDEEGYQEAYALDVSIQIKDGKLYQASWTIQSNFYESGNIQITQSGSATFTDYGATVVELPEDLIKR